MLRAPQQPFLQFLRKVIDQQNAPLRTVLLEVLSDLRGDSLTREDVLNSYLMKGPKTSVR